MTAARSQLDARVLIADDDRAMCEVLETGRQRRGFRVELGEAVLHFDMPLGAD